MTHRPQYQSGASLIEVLVAMLILSFGMLSLAGMLAYSVQLPKLSAFRATATILAAGHIERMRANPTGFVNGYYSETMTFHSPLPSSKCGYPSCTLQDIANQDRYETDKALQDQFPAGGGMRMVCNGACANKDGDLWIMWQEPETLATLNAANTDECPNPLTTPTFTAFSSPKPRCLHIRFKL